LNELKALLRFFVPFQEVFGTFNSKLAPAQQIMDQLKILNVHGPKVPIAFPVLTRLQNVELCFPVPQ
jgi:hypothetical protein